MKHLLFAVYYDDDAELEAPHQTNVPTVLIQTGTGSSIFATLVPGQQQGLSRNHTYRIGDYSIEAGILLSVTAHGIEPIVLVAEASLKEKEKP